MRALSWAIAGAIVLGAVAAEPAGDPEVPEKYLKVDVVKALLDRRQAVVLIDVRSPQQFADLHIKGARNIPLGDLPARLAEVPKDKDTLVVLY